MANILFSKAYNLGVNKSSGDYLCFIHDDVLFHTRVQNAAVLDVFRKKINYWV
jgi:glycosyltransferase involved in cell wall biosynthesis